MKKLFSLVLLLAGLFASAANVDTVSIRSDAMKRAYKAVVVTPQSYAGSKAKYPVVYLLHGLGGKYNDWIAKVPGLKTYADQYNLIIVCPDGAVNSWYFDSPVDSTARFETYVAVEIPAWIEAHYRTDNRREARAITGLSMGGHGGLYLGYRHPRYFGAAGSMSGALAIEYITQPFYGVSKRLGDTLNKARYHEYSILGILDRKPSDTLALIMDCGTGDFIIEMSRVVHKRLLELDIPHDYTERPGRHDWAYWSNAVQYQLLFFRNYFDRTAAGSSR